MTTAATLEDIFEALRSKPYEGPPGSGWGGVLGDESHDSPAVMRAAPGAPGLGTVRSGVLSTRFLTDHYSVRLARQFDDEMLETLPASYTHELLATDVLVYGEKTTTVLVGTHNAVERDRVMKALATAVATAGGGPPDVDVAHPSFVCDPDFFLWLIYRQNSNAKVSTSIELLGIRYARAMNQANQRVDFRDSASMDRAELLTVIGQAGSRFGSAKVMLLHRGLDLELDVHLSIDGSFSPFIGTSFYRKKLVQGTNVGFASPWTQLKS
jgi:hypothetical protein